MHTFGFRILESVVSSLFGNWYLLFICYLALGIWKLLPVSVIFMYTLKEIIA